MHKDAQLAGDAYLAELRELADKLRWAAAKAAGLDLEDKPEVLRGVLDLDHLQRRLEESGELADQALHVAEITLAVERGVHLDD